MAIRQCSLCYRTETTHRISKDAGLCSCCESALRYWKHKTPKQMVNRARQIDSFQARMSLVLGNVKSMPVKKRRTA